VIAVFTKYDQFRHDIRDKLEDRGYDADDPALLKAEMDKVFNKYYLANLRGSPPFVCLESKGLPTS
jgi:hypothetical protein